MNEFTGEVGSQALLRAAEEMLQAREVAAALDAFSVAEQAGADPDRCSSGCWMVHMLRGEFYSAWTESDAIRARGKTDPNRFWLGESVAGKRVIVRCLHGLGDAVQMLRYLPMLRARSASVTVEVPPRLLPLAPYFAGAEQIVTWGDEAPIETPEWDVQIEVMELPYFFRTAASELPIANTYLLPPQEAVRECAWKMGSSAGPRVGIVWSASDWDPTRCLPMDCLARMLAVPGAEFWNLQGGEQHARAKGSSMVSAMRDAADLGDGLVTLSSVIANMDLVITVDTLAAHLAGAMGKRAWVLLQHRADWRWMHQRDDSPWYPTLRLWRQASQDDWSGLATHVCNGLRSWLEQRQ